MGSGFLYCVVNESPPKNYYPACLALSPPTDQAYLCILYLTDSSLVAELAHRLHIVICIP